MAAPASIAFANSSSASFRMASGVHRIVLTGGPCGGKSTALNAISNFLKPRGFDVYMVPEAATLLLTGGAVYHGLNDPELIAFQTAIVASMIALEDNFMRIAESRRRPAVIICDRGTMDASAYMDADTWQTLLDTNNWSVPQLRDSRYDAVVHMMTAAMGAEKFYTTENNAVRTESATEACKIDLLLRTAWMGHPHLYVVDNREQFSDKVNNALAAICKTIGIPAPNAVIRKFALKSMPEIPVPFEEFLIDLLYLSNPENDSLRLQTRFQHSVRTYTLSCKRVVKDGDREQFALVERRLAPKEFTNFRTQVDKTRRPIKKIVRQCMYNQVCLTITEYIEPVAKRFYVEVQQVKDDSSSSTPDFPTWLPVGEEVTDAEAYNSYNLSFPPKQ